ncbi:hypothetical protein GGI15_002003 [Coemansia interrupta]|uniref:Uncharacterized protein n=1 Tax=Coemansia interrupta TaxID=1126814 RepID=A0A9W8HG16_9FUNG|nr:hypothetical protein GGI15_002003 [Coemansia interrupta]
MKRPLTLLSALAISLTAARADIVLSVAPADNLSEYLAVLSSAWPSLYPKLAAHLDMASSQVPAEYHYLMDTLLNVGAVPTEYDDGWARAFVGRAQEIGATTVVAEEIPGATGVDEQWVVSTEGGVVASAEVAVERPTIVVAVNGNYARNAHSVHVAVPTEVSSEESSEEDGGVESGDDVESSSSSSGAAQWPLGVAALGAAAIMALF